ncbi:MAG: galactokinase [Planctomycetota bacterium]
MATSSDSSIAEELERHCLSLVDRFGAGASPRAFFAPGRVNLMGAHLDYNGGPVMPTAIDRGTFVAVRLRRDRRLRIASVLDARVLEFDLDELPAVRAGRWSDYPIGVLRELCTRVPHDAPGLEILFGGNLPIGAGLSSSASICVGTAFALDRVWGIGLSRQEIVSTALAAERGFVGVQCGIMDPFAIGLARTGHILWLDCKDESSAYLPLDSAHHAIAVADSLVRRELAQGAFNERVQQCAQAFSTLRRHQPSATCLRDISREVLDRHRAELDPILARRAQHVVDEVRRTFRARDALLRGDPSGFGAEMLRAHASLRDLFEVSVPELDQLVESASACAGVLGARLTGAGFGGCVVVLLERGAEERVRARITEDYVRRFHRDPALAIFGGDSGPREVTGF